MLVVIYGFALFILFYFEVTVYDQYDKTGSVCDRMSGPLLFNVLDPYSNTYTL